MDENALVEAPEGAADLAQETTLVEDLVEDTLVEDVSIDGMCGVY